MESSRLWPNRRKPLVIGPLGIIQGLSEGDAVLVLRLLRRRQPDWWAVGQALSSLIPTSQSPEARRIMPSSHPPNVGPWLLRAIHSGLSGTRHYVSNPEIGVIGVSSVGSQTSFRRSPFPVRWRRPVARNPPNAKDFAASRSLCFAGSSPWRAKRASLPHHRGPFLTVSARILRVG